MAVTKNNPQVQSKDASPLAEKLPTIEAVSPGYDQPHTLTQSELLEMNKIRFWHRINVGLDGDGQPVYTPGEVNHGPNGGDWPTTRFGMPLDLTGKTVFDIGAWDGFFSFLAESRGASYVLAADVSMGDGGHWGGTDGFKFARAMKNSKVVFMEGSVYDCQSIDESNVNGFDIVLCYGVLYHLKYPQKAIEELFNAVKPGGQVIIETACNTDPLLNNNASWSFENMRDGDPTNFWYPTQKGLQVLLEWAGFTQVQLVYDMGSRMTMSATRPNG